MSVISAAGTGRASYTARTASMLTVPEARHCGDDVSGQPSPPTSGSLTAIAAGCEGDGWR